MTALPKSIQIGGRTYSVTKDRAYLDREAKAIGATDGLYGHTNNVVMEIVLDPESGPIRQRETLLHEVLHAVLDIAGLDEILSDGREEQIALRVAPWLLDTLRRNKQFTAFLLD